MVLATTIVPLVGFTAYVAIAFGPWIGLVGAALSLLLIQNDSAALTADEVGVRSHALLDRHRDRWEEIETALMLPGRRQVVPTLLLAGRRMVKFGQYQRTTARG